MNNPHDFSHSFCLPVLVITYLDAAVQRPLEFRASDHPKVQIEWDDATEMTATTCTGAVDETTRVLISSRGEIAEFVEVGLGEVVDRAMIWVQEWWPESLPGIKLIRPNPGLVKGCPAVQRFARAVSKLVSGKVGGSRQAILDDGFFGWHGTRSDAGITGICHEGFDPKRRAGQAHGPGEYFQLAHKAEVANGYAGGNGHMIVALILHERAIIRTVCSSSHASLHPCT